MGEQKPNKPGSMQQDTTPTKKGKSEARLGRDIQAKIGLQLRAYYDGLVEPAPDRFVKLLQKLDRPDDKEPSE